MSISKLRAVAASVIVLSASAWVSADSISDPGFNLTAAETASGTPYANYGYAYANAQPVQSVAPGAPVEDFSSTGFTFAGLTGICANGFVGLSGAPSGQAGFLQSYQATNAQPYISATFTATPGLYEVSFEAEASSAPSVSGNSILASLDGVTLPVVPTANFQTYSFAVPILTNGPETLSFEGTDVGGLEISFIDAVSVTSVPSPSEGCGIFLGFLGIWQIGSRRRVSC